MIDLVSLVRHDDEVRKLVRKLYEEKYGETAKVPDDWFGRCTEFDGETGLCWQRKAPEEGTR